jgi:hypothetical protein
MDQNNQENNIKNAVGVALLAPVGLPILHGLSGVAMVGLGLFAAGALVKTATTLTGLPEPPNPFEKLPRD